MRVGHYSDDIRFTEIIILSKVLKFFNYNYHDIVKLILIPEPNANLKRHILPRLQYSNHSPKQNDRQHVHK